MAATTRDGTMLLIISCLLWVSGVLADGGQYIVTHAPGHVLYRTTADKVQTSELADIIASSFGFQLDNGLRWNGLGQGNLFKRPKANVLFSIDGTPSTGLSVNNVAKYESEQDSNEVETEQLVQKIHDVSGSLQPLVLDFSIESTVFEVQNRRPALLEKVPSSMDSLKRLHAAGLFDFSPAQLGALNSTLDTDLLFLGELHILRGIVDALKAHPEYLSGQLPNFYHFKVKGLKKLMDLYGQDSFQVRDATALLETILNELTEAFKAIYGGNVVVQIVTLPTQQQEHDNEFHVRQKRSPQEGGAPAPVEPTTAPPAVPTDLNLAASYDELYPVIFNIILWLSVILVLAVYGISYGIWFMDPGRDSIIYRMTSTRIKKD